MLKETRAMLRILAIAIAVSTLLGVTRVKSEEPLAKIGVSVALTGPVGIVGSTIKNALVLAQQQFDPEHKIQFIFEDDAFQPKNTVTNVQKFISQDKVDGLVVFGASNSLSVAALAEERRVPLLGMTVLETFEAGKNYLVRFFSSTEELSNRTIEEFKKRGYKTAVVVASVQDATLRMRDQFVASKVATILHSQEYLPGELDFKATVSRISSLRPDAVYLVMLPPQGSTMAKQLRAGGYTGQIICSLQAASPGEVKNADGALVGAWTVTGDDRSAQEFYAGYNNAFPESRPMSETVYSYDLGKMIIEGVKSGDLNTYIHTVKDFHGGFGTYSANGKNSFTFKVTVKEITKDGYRYAD
jgi:branched-chain amino acid transport system substrate-binding protein